MESRTDMYLSTLRRFVEAIREEDAYGGRRVTLEATLGAARLKIQVDVGIGDAVTPAPQWLDYPSLLDLPRPRLRVYPARPWLRRSSTPWCCSAHGIAA